MLFDGDVFPLCLLRNRDRAFRKYPYAVTHHGRGNRCVLSHILPHSQGISSLRNVEMLFVSARGWNPLHYLLPWPASSPTNAHYLQLSDQASP